LLFTDLVMPNGISGQELLRRARDRRPDLKAVFTSGYSETFVAGTADRVAGIPLLNKPYRRHQIAQMIRKALDSKE
jgi:DNA-binding LytR/AlgR family response regulator